MKSAASLSLPQPVRPKHRANRRPLRLAQAEGAIDALFEHAAAPAGSVGDGTAVHGLLSLVGVLIRVVILLAADPNANPDVGRASDADVSCDARVRAEELAVDADGNDRGGAADVRAFFLGCAPSMSCSCLRLRRVPIASAERCLCAIAVFMADAMPRPNAPQHQSDGAGTMQPRI